MEINTFWKIVLKGIGLWLLMNCIYLIPQFFSSLSLINGSINWDTLMVMWIANIASLLLFIIIIRIFLLKTQWLVNLLKLDKQFNEERIDVNISGSKVLSIVVILIGALIFLQSLPELFSTVITLLKPQQDPEITTLKNADSYWTIYHIIRVIAGFLLMTNSKFIVNLIDKQTKNDIG
jgi:hypothetical protein